MWGKLAYPELSYRICGILYGIHNSLNRYCNEKQYGDAFEEELKKQKIIYSRELFLEKYFEGEKPKRNKVDFLIDNKIVVELKCERILTEDDYYQVKRYLISSGKRLGLLVNFREKYLRPKRILNSESKE
ncbi:MAG TPA: GxxExxY protein [Candidatus Moranbacteria bacterium]|nr:GxxExxY protein [Candidatus Moranbacteria bacterium]